MCVSSQEIVEKFRNTTVAADVKSYIAVKQLIGYVIAVSGWMILKILSLWGIKDEQLFFKYVRVINILWQWRQAPLKSWRLKLLS